MKQGVNYDDVGDEFGVKLVEQWAPLLTEEAVRPEFQDRVVWPLAVSFATREDFWERRVPIEWRTYFDALDDDTDDDDLQRVCDAIYDLQPLEAFPASLKEFLRNVRLVALEECVSDEQKKSAVSLPPEMHRGMSAKKVQEVSVLAKVVAEAAARANVKTVVDIGSGHGFLSRTISHVFGLRVVGIDCSAFHSASAATKAAKLERHVPEENRQMLDFVTCRIERDTAKADIERILRESCGDAPAVMCVLHACGDLFTTCMEVFSQSDQFRAFVGVGCCFSKNVSTELKAFWSPLSDKLKSRVPSVQLSEGSLMHACHSKNALQGPAFAYRCLFQKMLFDKRMFGDNNDDNGAALDSLKVGSAPKSALGSFSAYVRYIVAKDMNLPREIPNDWLEEYEPARSKAARRVFVRVKVFWALKAALGRAVESVVVRDRLQYFRERIAKCSLVTVFDLSVSPRNAAIVAEK
jgi:hypothetical protein